MAKPASTISLRAIKTFEQVCELPRDHFTIGNWTIMTDGIRVWINQQALGERPTDDIEVPKKIFDQLLAKYEKPMTPRKKCA